MTDQRLVLFLSVVSMTTSVIALLLAITRRKAARRKRQLMDSLFGEIGPSQLPEIEEPSLLQRLSGPEKLLGERYRNSLKEKLSKSGKVGSEFVTEIAKRKFLFGLFGLVVGAIYFGANGEYIKALLVGVFGFFLPDILLTNAIQKRGEAIEGALPDAVEMLTMCVEAGLTFQQALGKVAENQRTVIATEFARVMSEIQIGESRADALDGMVERLNHPEVKKFVTAMHQVDRLGIPISTVLKEQVKELRAKSKDRAREKAQKVPVKILGPVMACFLPSVLIIVLAPIILQTLAAFK